MKDVNQFIKEFIKIEYQTEKGMYGYYPFSMLVEERNGDISICCLAVDGVESAYLSVCKFIEKDPKQIYLALDFPAKEDIKTDFICVYSFVDRDLSLLAIPYDNKTGKRFDIIKDAKILEFIHRDFVHVAEKFLRKIIAERILGDIHKN